MDIEFYVKALPFQRKEAGKIVKGFRAREYFKLQSPDTIRNIEGKIVPRVDLRGEVESSVINANQKAYLEFSQLADKQGLVDKAIASPGVEFYAERKKR